MKTAKSENKRIYHITTFEPGTQAHNRLIQAAKAVTERTGVPTQVGETYYDAGQGMKWTTIFAQTGNGYWYQLLNPRDQDIIINGNFVEVSERLEMVMDRAAKKG